jgi:hypothetical protein
MYFTKLAAGKLHLHVLANRRNYPYLISVVRCGRVERNCFATATQGVLVAQTLPAGEAVGQAIA